MALNIETDEADRLAHALAALTGETMVEAVTKALRERLEREHARVEADTELSARLEQFVQHIRANYDTRPISQEEWDTAVGEPG